MNAILDRRSMLRGAAGALVIGFSVPAPVRRALAGVAARVDAVLVAAPVEEPAHA